MTFAFLSRQVKNLECTNRQISSICDRDTIPVRYAGPVWVSYTWKCCQVRLQFFSFPSSLYSFSTDTFSPALDPSGVPASPRRGGPPRPGPKRDGPDQGLPPQARRLGEGGGRRRLLQTNGILGSKYGVTVNVLKKYCS